jgi:hypothetical protein
LFTSAEASGAQAEYIRYGMDYNMWLKNIYMLLSRIPGLTIIVMSTYNALSVVGYKNFLVDLYDIKKTFPARTAKPEPQTRLILDIPYLRYPPHQSIFILPQKFQDYVTEQYEYIIQNIEYENGINHGFGRFESEKMRRVLDLIKSNRESDDTTLNRIDFVKFVDEHDVRRGTNFLKTYPEMVEFYNTIKEQL